jgi:hypothetical protein
MNEYCGDCGGNDVLHRPPSDTRQDLTDELFADFRFSIADYGCRVVVQPNMKSLCGAESSGALLIL